jgi:hypothetical protein
MFRIILAPAPEPYQAYTYSPLIIPTLYPRPRGREGIGKKGKWGRANGEGRGNSIISFKINY